MILVTGASGGIGSAICHLAAAHGYRVFVHYFEGRTRALAVASAIRARGGEAHIAQADLHSRVAIERLFVYIRGKCGRLDALVNNAAAVGPARPGLAISATRFRAALSLNVLGPFVCIQTAVPLMKRNARPQCGAIVNVSSYSVRTAGAHIHIDYAAGKAALESLTVGFAKELANDGIRVNAVAPGTIEGGMSSGLASARREKIEDRIPMHRLGTPEEVARSVLWLLSKDASYVTGAVLPVTGGR